MENRKWKIGNRKWKIGKWETWLRLKDLSAFGQAGKAGK